MQAFGQLPGFQADLSNEVLGVYNLYTFLRDQFVCRMREVGADPSGTGTLWLLVDPSETLKAWAQKDGHEVRAAPQNTPWHLLLINHCGRPGVISGIPPFIACVVCSAAVRTAVLNKHAGEASPHTPGHLLRMEPHWLEPPCSKCSTNPPSIWRRLQRFALQVLHHTF